MQVTFENVSEMQTEIAPRLGLDSIVAFEDEQSWFIALDEAGLDKNAEPGLHVQYGASIGQLLIHVELCALPEPPSKEALSLMMQYNMMWRETGGLVLSQDELGGPVMLTTRVPTYGLDGQRLGEALEHIVKKIEPMRILVASGFQLDDEHPDEEPKAHDSTQPIVWG